MNFINFDTCTLVEPPFNEMPGDWVNWFVISTIRYIVTFDITILRKNNQNIRYVEIE